MKQLIPLCLFGFFQLMSTTAEDLEVFDMDAIRDPATLETKVLQDWQTFKGPNIACLLYTSPSPRD